MCQTLVRSDDGGPTGAGTVADLGARNVLPGGTEDPALRSQMMAMIEHCPSGALTFRLTVDGPDIEPDLPAGIAVTDDGPYFVTGGIPVERSDGEPFGPRPRMTLCRCGGSANKPLCDGSHKEIGFRDSYAPPS